MQCSSTGCSISISMQYYSSIDFHSLNRNPAVVLVCSAVGSVVHTVCPLSFLDVSLACDKIGVFIVSCVSTFLPSCTVLQSNVDSVCNMVRYSEYAVECKCAIRPSIGEAGTGVIVLSSVTINNSSVSSYFYPKPEEPNGSIYIHISAIYFSVILLFTINGILHSKANRKTKHQTLQHSHISESIENYMRTNFFDKIFDGMFEVRSSFSHRALRTFVRRLRLFRLLYINSERKNVSLVYVIHLFIIYLFVF